MQIKEIHKWLEIVIFNNNFVWHFNSCDYSISRTYPGTLPHLQCVRLPASAFEIWRVCFSRMVVMCLLKKITKHAILLTYAYLTKIFRKLEKHVRRRLFCESCGITDHCLLKVKFKIDALLEIFRWYWLQY